MKVQLRSATAAGGALWPAKRQDLAAGAGELLIAEREQIAVGFICMLKPDEHGSVYIDNLHAMPEYKVLRRWHSNAG